MNFLGHLWLADRTGTSLPGAMLGDWVRGRDHERYPVEIALGIRLHRRVDTLTDRHPAILEAIGGFPAESRRYAAVLIDLVSDHCIATHWERLHHEPLRRFAARAASDVASAGRWFKEAGARPPIALMLSELLKSYASPTGIETAMMRTSMRLRRPDPMLAAVRHWPAAAERLTPRIEELLNDLEQGVRDAMDEFETTRREADPGRPG